MKARYRRSAWAFVVLGIAVGHLGAQASAPRYEVDLSWPKPLPDRWIIGGLGGVCVDAHNHVRILNRQDLREGERNAGHLAPPLIEVEPAGNVINSGGEPNV